MGLEVDPNKSFAYVPVLDRTLPESEQRKLKFRYLTARKADEMQDQLDAAKVYQDIAEALKLALVGWENLKDENGNVDYDPAKLPDLFTRAELHELRDDILSFMTMDGLAKKKAASQSQATSATSAK